jgi:hypothetical protein
VLGDGTPAPVLVGTGSPGDEIIVRTAADALVGSVPVDGLGGWRLSVGGIGSGTHAVRAWARNAAGTGGPTPAVAVRVAAGGLPNRPPSVGAVADIVVLRDGSAGPVPFTVGDAETAAADLTLGRSSSRRSVVPLDGIRFGGSGATRSVSIVPAPGRTGTSAVTITVSDGQATADRTFLVVVRSGDTTVPATPAAPVVAGDGTPAPPVSGTTAAYATVTIFRGATAAVLTVGADGSGAWSAVLSGWPSGAHAVSITAANDVGTSPRSPAVMVRVVPPTSAPPTGGSGGGGGGGCGSGSGLGLVLCGVWLLVCRTRFRSRRSG